MEQVDIGHIPHNRGHKLKSGAERVHEGRRLWTHVVGDFTSLPSIPLEETNAAWLADAGGAEDGGDLGQARQLAAITRELGRPLARGDDALQRPNVQWTLVKCNYLGVLASNILDMVAQENALNKRLRQLLAVLLGDDPLYIRPAPMAGTADADPAGKSTTAATGDPSLSSASAQPAAAPPQFPEALVWQVRQALAQSDEYIFRLQSIRNRLVAVENQKALVRRRLRWLARRDGSSSQTETTYAHRYAAYLLKMHLDSLQPPTPRAKVRVDLVPSALASQALFAYSPPSAVALLIPQAVAMQLALPQEPCYVAWTPDHPLTGPAHAFQETRSAPSAICYAQVFQEHGDIAQALQSAGWFTEAAQCWAAIPHSMKLSDLFLRPLRGGPGTLEQIQPLPLTQVVIATPHQELYDHSQVNGASQAFSRLLRTQLPLVQTGVHYTLPNSSDTGQELAAITVQCLGCQPVLQGQIMDTTQVILVLSSPDLPIPAISPKAFTAKDDVVIDSSFLWQRRRLGYFDTEALNDLEQLSLDSDSDESLDDEATLPADGCLEPQGASQGLELSGAPPTHLGAIIRMAPMTLAAQSGQLTMAGLANAPSEWQWVMSDSSSCQFNPFTDALVTYATLAQLGIHNGAMVQVTYGHRSARVCRVWAWTPPVQPASTGRPHLWLSPVLASNLNIPYRVITNLLLTPVHGKPASQNDCKVSISANFDHATTTLSLPLLTACQPKSGASVDHATSNIIPQAHRVTLARISSPVTQDTQLYEGLLQALTNQLAHVGEWILKVGDIIPVVLDAVDTADRYELLANDQAWSELATGHTLNYALNGQLGCFQVTDIQPSSSTTTPGNPLTLLEQCYRVHTDYTEIIQVGLAHGYVPYCLQIYYQPLASPSVERGAIPALFPAFQRLLDIVTALLTPTTQRLRIPTTVLLHGPMGSGKSTTVNWVSQWLGLHVYTVICSELAMGNPTPQTMAKALGLHWNHVARYSPCIVVLKGLEAIARKNDALETGQDPPIVHTLKSLFSQLPEVYQATKYPLVVVGTCEESDALPPSLLPLFQHEIQIQAPPESTRRAILDTLLRTSCCAPDVALRKIAQETASFLPRDLVQLVARTVLTAWARAKRAYGLLDEALSTKGSGATNDPKGQRAFIAAGPPDQVSHTAWQLVRAGVALTAQDWDEALGATRAEVSDGLGVPKIPNVAWEDVGGLASVKQDILDTVQLPLDHPELFAQGLKKRSGILFYGPPGTGKTLLAKAVATSCSLNFFSVKGPELLNMYIGESEANVRRVFQKARDARPCVIFFDELDSLAPKRGQQGDSGGVMDRIVSQLLAELDDMSSPATPSDATGDIASSSAVATATNAPADIFVIGATNRPDLLDPALLRPGRFDKLIYLGISESHADQQNILQALTRKFLLAPDLELAQVAEQCPFNYTGADFYALCSDAMLKAMLRQVDLVTQKVAAINEAHASLSPKGVQTTSSVITPQYYLEHLATAEDTQIVVTMADFTQALKDLVPSVPMEELERYKRIRDQFAQAPAQPESNRSSG
ncbi:peroxisomal assembly protein [Dimargaris xerosporica]|nr:peroxisomal assembly protein [Dimargaris xerosporica]